MPYPVFKRRRLNDGTVGHGNWEIWRDKCKIINYINKFKKQEFF